jgi:hypothetical protein
MKRKLGDEGIDGTHNNNYYYSHYYNAAAFHCDRITTTTTMKTKDKHNKPVFLAGCN